MTEMYMKATTRSETARVTGVIVRGTIFTVMPGSYDCDTRGNERYLTPDGKILQFKDSAIQGYQLEEIKGGN
jgi:hypothetical protein